MKNCRDCKYADWKLTTAGKLHPSGDGKCRFEWIEPPRPACMYPVGKPQTITGRYINRREDFKEHCVTYFPKRLVKQ